jgi:hypothetical protein
MSFKHLEVNDNDCLLEDIVDIVDGDNVSQVMLKLPSLVDYH